MTIFQGVFKAGANREYVMVILKRSVFVVLNVRTYISGSDMRRRIRKLLIILLLFYFYFAFFAFYFVNVLVLFVIASFKIPTNKVTILVENKFCRVQPYPTIPAAVTCE